MKTHRFEWLLGAVLAVVFVAFWIWQSPGNLQKLSSAEVDAYLHRLEGTCPETPGNRLRSLRACAPSASPTTAGRSTC